MDRVCDIVSLQSKSVVPAFLMSCTVVFGSANAEYIQFTFTGEITEFVGGTFEPWEDAQIGDQVKIQYVFDSEAEDQYPAGDDSGRYDFLEFSFDINGQSLVTSAGYIDVQWDEYFPDYYYVNYMFGGGNSGGISFSGIDMLYSDSLPTNVDWTEYTLGTPNGVIGTDSSLHLKYDLFKFSSEIVPSAPSIFIFLTSACFYRRRKTHM